MQQSKVPLWNGDGCTELLNDCYLFGALSMLGISYEMMVFELEWFWRCYSLFAKVVMLVVCAVCVCRECRCKQERPYHDDNTASRLLSEVKHHRARLVLRWGTTLESRVLFFCSFAPFCHATDTKVWISSWCVRFVFLVCLITQCTQQVPIPTTSNNKLY